MGVSEAIWTRVSDLGQSNPRSRDRLLLMAKPKTKVGQAPALSRALWEEWLQWLLKSRGPRMMVVVKLTGCFGLRAGEAVALKREDIVLHGGVPKICVTGETAGARKSPGEVYIRLKDLGFVKLLLTKGIAGKHTRGHKHGKRLSGGGRRRTIEKLETYRAPKTGYLFTARKNAAQKHLSYHAVYLAVRQEAPKFFEHLKKEGRLVPEVTYFPRGGSGGRAGGRAAAGRAAGGRARGKYVTGRCWWPGVNGRLSGG